MVKHTPRPWTIKECDCPDNCGQFFLSVSRSDGRLDRADAVLIAASPDMFADLEECKKIAQRAIDELGCECGHAYDNDGNPTFKHNRHCWGKPYRKFITKVEKTIAKAEGKDA